MVKLTRTIGRLCPIKVLVIGDLLLDAYTIGKARRISPEAPVAVVQVQQEDYRPGGAGNVMLNLISLGAQVVSIGRVGKDWAGEKLCHALEHETIDTRFIIKQENYQTPVKNRIIAENQQIVRVDHERMTNLPEPLEQQIIDFLPEIVKDVKVIAISDYGKGFLTESLLSALIGFAKVNNVIVIADPKGYDFSKYAGATILKPNLSEAYIAAGLPMQACLQYVSQKVLEITQAEMLMITRSECGISLFNKEGEQLDFPVQAREVKDVTGAGDTVLAMLTCALANGLSYSEAACLCNVAAGIAIEHMGCVRVTLSDLTYRLLEIDTSNKIFDKDHLFVLQEVLKNKPFNLLAFSSSEGFTPQLFKVIKLLTQEKKSALLIYLTDTEIEQSYIEMLTSLKEVDFLLLHPGSLTLLDPQESYLFENGKLESLAPSFELLFLKEESQFNSRI